jgi:hypothetical protein
MNRALKSLNCNVVGMLAMLFCLGMAAAVPARAQVLEGKYRCAHIDAGRGTQKCQSPPLVLHRNGTYDIWGEHGTYEVVQGRWLVLSHSKRRGLGHFISGEEITFEYRMDGKVCRVTFHRIFKSTPGFMWG